MHHADAVTLVVSTTVCCVGNNSAALWSLPLLFFPLQIDQQPICSTDVSTQMEYSLASLVAQSLPPLTLFVPIKKKNKKKGFPCRVTHCLACNLLLLSLHAREPFGLTGWPSSVTVQQLAHSSYGRNAL